MPGMCPRVLGRTTCGALALHTVVLSLQRTTPAAAAAAALGGGGDKPYMWSLESPADCARRRRMFMPAMLVSVATLLSELTPEDTSGTQPVTMKDTDGSAATTAASKVTVPPPAPVFGSATGGVHRKVNSAIPSVPVCVSAPPQEAATGWAHPPGEAATRLPALGTTRKPLPLRARQLAARHRSTTGTAACPTEPPGGVES